MQPLSPRRDPLQILSFRLPRPTTGSVRVDLVEHARGNPDGGIAVGHAGQS